LGREDPEGTERRNVPKCPAQKSITLKPHQLAAVEEIFSVYKNGYPGLLLADDVGLGKTFAAWAGISK
jgi:SNF2 family DNA or RNA helicase